VFRPRPLDFGPLAEGGLAQGFVDRFGEIHTRRLQPSDTRCFYKFSNDLAVQCGLAGEWTAGQICRRLTP
jgi:hypothetical protein